MKIGFGIEKDIENIKEIKNIIPKNYLLMVDANQAWNVKEAIKNCNKLETFDLNWLEEPIPADSSLEDWRLLCEKTNIPLAAGENFSGHEEFSKYFKNKVFKYLQPDIAKWGGFSECISLVKNIKKNNITYCPHFLGGGIGLLASAHLLSASNDNGMLEVDINKNPLRSDIINDMITPTKGCLELNDKPGLGCEPNLKSIHQYLVAH